MAGKLRGNLVYGLLGKFFISGHRVGGRALFPMKAACGVLKPKKLVFQAMKIPRSLTEPTSLLTTAAGKLSPISRFSNWSNSSRDAGKDSSGTRIFL